MYRYLLSFLTFLKSLPANFLFVFCRIFAGKATIIYRNAHFNILFLYMFRVVLNSMSGWSATPSLPEQNLCQSMDRRAWRPYVDSTESWLMTRAWCSSVPTIQVSTAFISRPYRVSNLESFFHFTRFSLKPFLRASLSVPFF
jgi:hypothetical protein